MTRRPEEILVGLDPIHDGHPVVGHAADLARRFGARIVLFDAVYNQYVSRRYFKDGEALEHARQTLVKEHRERLERLAADLRGPDLDITTGAEWDTPVDEALIRAAARHRADWILVGLGEHPIHHRPFFAGSDWQLVRHAPCPLLLSRCTEWSSTPRIIAAVDPLHRHGKPEDLDQRILQAGAALCGGGQGRLFVFHAFEPIIQGLGGRDMEPLPVEYAEATLEGAHNAAVAALLDDVPDCPTRVRIAEGKPEEKLPEFAAEIRADLVIMGAVARNPLHRVFIGSTAERVLDRLESDILVIKPGDFVSPVPLETGSA